jgi:hypothetical protein
VIPANLADWTQGFIASRKVTVEWVWLSASTPPKRNPKRNSGNWPWSRTARRMVLTAPTEDTHPLRRGPPLLLSLRRPLGLGLQRRVFPQRHWQIPPFTPSLLFLLAKKIKHPDLRGSSLLLQGQPNPPTWSRGLAIQTRASANVPACAGLHRSLRVLELVVGEACQVSFHSDSQRSEFCAQLTIWSRSSTGMSKKNRGAELRVRGTTVGLCDLFASDRCLLSIQYPIFNQCAHMTDRLL